VVLDIGRQGARHQVIEALTTLARSCFGGGEHNPGATSGAYSLTRLGIAVCAAVPGSAYCISYAPDFFNNYTPGFHTGHCAQTRVP